MQEPSKRNKCARADSATVSLLDMAEEKETLLPPPSYTPDTSQPGSSGQPPQKGLPYSQPPYYSPNPPPQHPPAVVLEPLQDRPSDHLGLSIFSILCCFWPLGIVALIKSMESRSHYFAGRYNEAVVSSRESLTYNKIAIGIGIAINIVIWVFVIIAIALNVSLVHVQPEP